MLRESLLKCANDNANRAISHAGRSNRGSLFTLLRTSIVLWLAVSGLVFAEHPIDVERLSANGDHLKALAAYDRIPLRVRTIESTVAAGKSAWALGLAERAIKEFEAVLKEPSLKQRIRAELLLNRAIIEYQEGRTQSAIFFVEKASALGATNPAISSAIYMLWGDALMQADTFGAAEEKYERAMQDANNDERSEISYRLGLCRERLGKQQAAEESFERVSLKSERTPETIRHLALLALDAQRYDDVRFWLEKGRNEFPQQFLDSWTDYALLKAALQKKDSELAKKIYSEAQKKYPPSDPWLVMLNAEAEVTAWKQEAP